VPQCAVGVVTSYGATSYSVSFADCNGNMADGCETRITDDANNCGKCGNVCKNQNVCSGGMCVMNSAQQAEADAAISAAIDQTEHQLAQYIDSKTTTTTQPPTTQPPTTTTTATATTSTVRTTTLPPCDGAYCNGVCKATSNDRNNCGGCGVTCGSTQLCLNGQCTDACASLPSRFIPSCQRGMTCTSQAGGVARCTDTTMACASCSFKNTMGTIYTDPGSWHVCDGTCDERSMPCSIFCNGGGGTCSCSNVFCYSGNGLPESYDIQPDGSGAVYSC
jgi:hypothetical protein